MRPEASPRVNSAPAPRPNIEAPPEARSRTLELHGCRVVMRRVEGPEADEIFLNCQAPAGVTGPGGQAEAIYRAIRDVLAAEDADYGAVVSETVFVRDIPVTVEAVRAARRLVLGEAHRPGGAAPVLYLCHEALECYASFRCFLLQIYIVF